MAAPPKAHSGLFDSFAGGTEAYDAAASVATAGRRTQARAAGTYPQKSRSAGRGARPTAPLPRPSPALRDRPGPSALPIARHVVVCV